MRASRWLRLVSWIWAALPAPLQRGLSSIYSRLYDLPVTKYLIPLYCKFNYGEDSHYLERFKPASGHEKYQSYQDFFIRKLKRSLELRGRFLWPCDGYLCESGKVALFKHIHVKGDWRDIRTAFGPTVRPIPNDYYYGNIFLHNCGYHRVHSPVCGIIRRVQRVAGELIVLRPWLFPEGEASRPALRNERVNVDIEDDQGRFWFLSIVGGFGVGTVLMADHMTVGTRVNAGEEMALFKLGSTCCLATPIEPAGIQLWSRVSAGAIFAQVNIVPPQNFVPLEDIFSAFKG